MLQTIYLYDVRVVAKEYIQTFLFYKNLKKQQIKQKIT